MTMEEYIEHKYPAMINAYQNLSIIKKCFPRFYKYLKEQKRNSETCAKLVAKGMKDLSKSK